jgi:hypothetical protein
MPSSDLILAENGCSSADGGGRFVRIVTCVDGWVCIVLTHYDRQLHGGIYPVGANGKLVDEETGRPHLERALVSGVELLRCVCYQLARCDDFAFAVQVAYEEAGKNGDPSGGGGGGGGGGGPNEAQEALVRELYDALRPPLDERLRMAHTWLPQKPDTAESVRCFGPRGRWDDSPHVS